MINAARRSFTSLPPVREPVCILKHANGSVPPRTESVSCEPQNRVFVVQEFLGIPLCVMAGVCCGSGENGRRAAEIVSDTFPPAVDRLVNARLRAQLMTLSGAPSVDRTAVDEMLQDMNVVFDLALSKIHVQMISTGSEFDHSGVTMACVVVVSNVAFVVNVGDNCVFLVRRSRVVRRLKLLPASPIVLSAPPRHVSTTETRFSGYHLARVHTPESPRERDRLKRAGATESTVQGDTGTGRARLHVGLASDPDRAAAFSRCLGHRALGAIGVKCECSCAFKLMVEGKHVAAVIGTSSVFEALSDTDIVSLATDGTPQDAVKAIIETASARHGRSNAAECTALLIHFHPHLWQRSLVSSR